MRDLESIIGEYREADSEKRLYFFLDCPSLRNDFMEIELQSGMKEKNSLPDNNSTKLSVWKRMLSYADLL
jgi:hypothetical protein